MKYLFTIISFLFSFYIKAQTANFKAVEQKGQQIYITYDLQGSPGTYNIKLFVKSNNSYYLWSPALKSVSGNVGSNQTVGSNKEIIWDVLKDRDEFQGDWIFGIEAVNITEKNKKANKEKATVKEKNFGKFCISYNGDVKRTTGFGFSFLPNKKIGLYFNATINGDWDGNDKYNSSIGIDSYSYAYDEILPTGQIKFDMEMISFGITRKILYPLWIYLGIGIDNRFHQEYCDTYINSNYYDSRWIEFVNLSSREIVPQIGLFLKVKRVVFNSGLLISKNGIYGQFGLGILLFKGKG